MLNPRRKMVLTGISATKEPRTKKRKKRRRVAQMIKREVKLMMMIDEEAS